MVSRNFEALKRAEEQLEREDIARKEVGSTSKWWPILRKYLRIYVFRSWRTTR